ncbi:hypothetical protein Ndes2526B_g04636 [Nannochloris sp. 'desiccata']
MVLPTRFSSTRIGSLNMLSAMRSQPADNKNSLKKSGSSSNLSQLQSTVTATATAGALARIVPQASSTAMGSTQQPSLASLVTSSIDFEERLHDIVAAEVESAIAIAVRNAMEKEMVSVEEAVSNALKADRNSMDLRANVNTLVAVIGIVIFERGVWTAWDVCFGDSAWSEVVSVGIGLGILTAIRVFNIPLAEWRKP